MKGHVITWLVFIFMLSGIRTGSPVYPSERVACIESAKSCLKDLRNGDNYHCGWLIRDNVRNCNLNLEKDVGISDSELQHLFQKECMKYALETLKGFQNPDLYDEELNFGFTLLVECLDVCGLFLKDVIANKMELEKFREMVKKEEFVERLEPDKAESERWRKLLFD